MRGRRRLASPSGAVDAASGGGRGLTEDLIAQLGYVGFFLVLVLGGLGLPVPEEVPVVLAGVLSKKGTLVGAFAFGSCLVGVLAGDFVVYGLGYVYGEKVLSLPLTRKFLTRPREAQIKGYFHRHGIKILIFARFAVGFRTAAYLTAGILKLPALKLFLTDLCAATISTTLFFAAGYIFAHQIEQATAEIRHWQQAITWGLALALATWVLVRLVRFYKARRTIGQPVGPPVLVEDAPLPPDDLHSGAFAAVPAAGAPTEPNSEAPSEPDPQAPLPARAGGRGPNGGMHEGGREPAGFGSGIGRLEENPG